MSKSKVQLLSREKFGELSLQNKNAYLQEVSLTIAAARNEPHPQPIGKEALARLRRFYMRRRISDLGLEATKDETMRAALGRMAEALHLGEVRAVIAHETQLTPVTTFREPPSSNDFHALARYLVRGKPGSNPHPDRVAWVFSQNLPTDDPELVANYMTATAQLSRRTKNAAYHMMIAWHERERPSPELMQQIARQTLELAGLAEYQALIMGHGDKPHRHLHILLNRVHPDTGRAWKTTHDFARLDRIMQHLSEVHGCEYHPAHAFNSELTDELPKQPNSLATYAAKRGAQTTRPQWSRKTSRELGKEMSEDLSMSSTPDDIEAALADRGLTLEPKGKGFVVGNAEGYAKLSSLGLTSSGHSERTIKLASGLMHPRSRSKRRLFNVDAIDIAQAFHTMGLLTKDELRDAIADTVADRNAIRAAKAIADPLAGDIQQTLALSTALTPSRKQSYRVRQAKASLRPSSRAGR